MKNLKGFNLKTEYNENNMPYPGVSYVNDEEKVYFEKESYIIATYSSVINNNIEDPWYGGGYDAFYQPQCGGELIKDYAFYLNYRSNATQINFEENSQLEYIGDSAFSVPKLTSVEIPNSVKHIGNNNFYNTYSLSSITIQEDSKLEYIGASTFGHNYNLKTFTLPKSVIKIGDDYIVNTEGVDYPLDGNYLETLYVDKDNPIYNDGNGSNCIIETATNTLLVSTPATTLPSTVTRIGDHAYDCIGENYVTSEMINIVEGIEYIGHEIIDYGSSHKTLYLPSTLKEIASRAFFYCDNLTEVISKAMIAPEYSDSMFYMNTTCVLKVPQGAIGYDAWIEKLPNWTIEYITE